MHSLFILLIINKVVHSEAFAVQNYYDLMRCQEIIIRTKCLLLVVFF